jgi:predicted nucleotide-binding protein (sugar kinase/HSP70/actin superfamily)
VAGYFGYQHWIENQIGQEVREIQEKVLQGDGEVNHEGRVKTELDRAKKALQMGKHRQAKRALDRIEELLDR